jgi:hypothetical protein
VVFFAGVTLAVGWLGNGWPDIPHPVGGDRAACTACHATDHLPASHHDRVDGDCRSCHSEKPAEASASGGRPDSDESTSDGAFQVGDRAFQAGGGAGAGAPRVY